MEPVTSYETTDLALAAFLLETGIDLLGAEQKERRVHFFFSDEHGNAQVAVRAYLNGAGLPAVRFAERMRNLKGFVSRMVAGDRHGDFR